MDERGEKQDEKRGDRELLEEILKIVQRNEQEIKKIRRYMRRTLISKLIYWGIIVMVTVGAVYAARPYVQKGIETYRSIRANIREVNGFVEEPAALFKDVEILHKLFERKGK